MTAITIVNIISVSSALFLIGYFLFSFGSNILSVVFKILNVFSRSKPKNKFINNKDRSYKARLISEFQSDINWSEYDVPTYLRQGVVVH